MSKTPQQLGREYEEDFARRIGGRVVPMSGAGFQKLDVFGYKMLLSLKHTIKKSFRVGDELFDEIRTAIYGHGGVGPDYIGAVVIKTEDVEAVALTLDDFLRLVDRLETADRENAMLRTLRKGEGITEDEITTALGEGYSVPTGKTRSFPSKKLPSRSLR